MAPEGREVVAGGVRLDDRRLAEAFTGGAEWAFRELYRRHTPRLYRLLARLVPAGTDAEELVQETWLRAARALPRFRWRAALTTWLSGIALNVLRERARVDLRRPAAVPLDDLEEARASASPGTGLDVDLERAVAALPPGYRAVLLLHDVEGHTHDEIASLLGIAPGTSKSQLANARRTLRVRLGDASEDRR
jgi:RNA polymerase sigma-70 factor (ECF subfamily)